MINCMNCIFYCNICEHIIKTTTDPTTTTNILNDISRNCKNFKTDDSDMIKGFD